MISHNKTLDKVYTAKNHEELMDALDYSADMPEKARQKGVYQDHIQADLSKPLDLPENRYDAQYFEKDDITCKLRTYNVLA